MFDIAESLVMLQLAEAAYTMAETNAAVLPEGYELVGLIETDQDIMDRAKIDDPWFHLFADNGQFGYVAKNGDTALLGIRGTRNNAEWWTDFQFWPVEWEVRPGIKVHVHRGMLRAHQAIFQSILFQVQQSGCKKVRGVFHSLGCGLGHPAMLELALLGYDVQQPSYAFASPRFGMRDFVEYFNLNVPNFVRIVNHLDPVPHLPDTILGFRDAGGHNGQFVDSQGSPLAKYRHALSSYQIGIQRLSGLMPMAPVAAAMTDDAQRRKLAEYGITMGKSL